MIAETMECDFREKKSNTPHYKLKSSNDKENGIDEALMNYTQRK